MSSIFSELSDPTVATMLRAGAVGVIPTDTLYGIVASTQHADAVERVYRLRHRDPKKACIVLIGDKDQLDGAVSWLPVLRAAADCYWPGPLSIILPVTADAPHYLTRGASGLACRLPADDKLRELLQKTGPIIAPSANLEGQPPATTLAEARQYFGDQIDFYVDGGVLQGQPSTLISESHGELKVLRQGSLDVPT